MNKTDYKNLDAAALKQEVTELKKELFNLKLNSSTMHVKNYSQFKKLRKNVARALTHLRGHENG